MRRWVWFCEITSDPLRHTLTQVHQCRNTNICINSKCKSDKFLYRWRQKEKTQIHHELNRVFARLTVCDYIESPFVCMCFACVMVRLHCQSLKWARNNVNVSFVRYTLFRLYRWMCIKHLASVYATMSRRQLSWLPDWLQSTLFHVLPFTRLCLCTSVRCLVCVRVNVWVCKCECSHIADTIITTISLKTQTREYEKPKKKYKNTHLLRN